MEKVSVIVPVYNSESFLRQCLESIACQSYPVLEIILIDDGSDDESLKICQEYGLADERIRILCQAHQGVSAARNRGLAAATGAYLLFVDSDDMIHPRLVEAFAEQMEKSNADLAFCNWWELESHEMGRAWSQLLEKKVASKWELAERQGVEEWIYEKLRYVLSGIGGKMIRRSIIGSLTFDERLLSGEDTVFLYCLFCEEIRMAYLDQEWYLYRRHTESITYSLYAGDDSYYFDCCRIGRDYAYAKGKITFATFLEHNLSAAIGNAFIERNTAGDREGCECLKRQAVCELKQPMFWKLDFVFKVWFLSSIFGGPLYGLLRRPWLLMQKLFRKGTDGKADRRRADIGILTFHCADNYGAMLQAYSLKKYLYDSGINAEIVSYEPPFMTGRHWWIPYIPQKNEKGRHWKDRLWRICNQYKIWKSNLSMKKDFFWRRANMRNFRKQYLQDAGQKRIFFVRQLKQLPYSRYIVGSDQIWNPEITFGLRKAYFGAFENKRKKKVIAYAASLGGAELSPEYDREFAALLCAVDVISLREAEAVPYVKRFCEKTIEAVLDPVFLLDRERWVQIEERSKHKGYILVYLAESNEALNVYASALSEAKGLPVVKIPGVELFGGKLKGGVGAVDENFEVESVAGPAEFLGLIHKADYVVTNSFHVTAFSIIYQKQFIVFLHTNRGTRIRNILRIYGLEDRLYREGRDISIDAPIDWNKAERRAEKEKQASKAFLMEHLGREI